MPPFPIAPRPHSALRMPAALATPVASLHKARWARAARRRLQAELAGYRTPVERAELAAILSRHTEAELDELAALTGWRNRVA